MKKILFLAAFALVGMSANAQLVTTTSRSIKVEKTPSNTIWLIRGGLTFAGLSGSDASDTDSRTGFNIGIEFQKPIHQGLYWGSGLGLKTKGYKWSNSGYKDEMNLTALEIPLNIGYKFDIIEDVKLDLHAGAFANFDLFGSKEYDSPYGSSDVSLSDFEDYSRFDGGLSLGFGVWYQRFNINLNFQWGLFEQMDDFNAKESNVMLSLGYAF